MENLVVCPGLLGDALCSFPAVLEYAKQRGPIGVYFRNRNIIPLVPKHENLFLLGEEPAEAKELNIHDLFGTCVHTGHMTQAYFKGLGLPVPAEAPRIPLTQDTYLDNLYSKFDFLISPYSISDDRGNKAWPMERWESVIEYLTNIGSVGVLGVAKGFPNLHMFSNVTMILDQPLDVVACLIRKAGMVLSVDNGISHLTAAIGTPHVLLYPAALPLCWVRNANHNVVTMQNTPINIQVHEVINSVHELQAML